MYPESLQIYESLEPGDRVAVIHEVKVGFQRWKTRTTGRVVSKQRGRHGLHFRRHQDDKVFSDLLILQRPDGELTTITLDEFSDLEKLA